ncbi:MAG: amidohydrolase family protein [Bacteroidetes bacterium]|nr:amidohydrolase family protein [Bacteroidota bacterium]
MNTPSLTARLLTLTVVLLWSSAPALAQDYSEVVIADAHVHLLDFLQNGDYLEGGEIVPKRPGAALTAGERGKRIEALLWAMDRANVSHALVSGMPFVKKWSEDETFRSTYYLDSSSRVVRARDTDYHVALAIVDFKSSGGETAMKQLERLYPCVSGFDSTDLGAVDMIAKRMKEFPGVFKCIGEVMSRHDDLTNLTTGERPRANHPALLRIFDFAGQHSIPVSIHHNIAPISVGTVPKGPLYLPELLEVFNEFPGTTFIWCHAGISRRILVADLTDHLSDVLTAHGNHVVIDLSWVVYSDYILKDLDSWAALIRTYPDNFVLGSDAVGRFGDYTDQIRIYDPLFAALGDAELIQKLASTNFLRIMSSDGVVLNSNYAYSESKYTRRITNLLDGQ